MEWIWLTGVSVIFRAVYGVMTKVLSNKLLVSPYTQATLLSFSGGIISLILAPLLGGLSLNFNGVSLITILLVVLGQGLGNIVYFAAIKNLTNGTAQISFSSILIFNTFLSFIFLNLHLSFINIMGIVLLILAVLCVVSGKIEFHKKGVSLMILSAFLFSVFQLASAKLSKEVGPSTYLVIAYFGAAAVVFLLNSKVVIKDLINSKKLKNTLGIPLLVALPSLGNFLFAYYAYRSAPQPAKVAMLLTSQVVITVLLSYFFLNEKDHLPRKVGASILVVLSAVLIKS
ncbi:MAG TPA: DMT family transporter [Candidatus Saccharimonadales bacterium]